MKNVNERRGHSPTLLKSALLALLVVFYAADLALSQSSPTGPAGGVLAGTYPNPDLAVDRVRKTGDSIIGSLSISIPNPGDIRVPFILSTTGNPLLNRGLAVQFQVPSGSSGGIGYSMLGGQITNGWGANAQTYMSFSGFNGSAMAEVFRLDGRGVVGIGTTTPSTAYKLDVNGEINATGFRINGTPIATGGASQWTTREQYGLRDDDPDLSAGQRDWSASSCSTY